ncbi:hypothetical protein N9112_00165 [bacterium]|nr:hypothetical protein [bacterium]
MLEKHIPLDLPAAGSKILVLNSDLNPMLVKILVKEGMEIVVDPEQREEVDIAFVVTRIPGKNAVMPTIKELEWRFIHPMEDFKTTSQKELAELDWEMLKALESLLPPNHPLRVKREALRSNVDTDIAQHKRRF